MRTLYTQALLAATTLVVAACSSNGYDGNPMPPAQNSAPVVSAISNRSVDQDTVSTIEFGIADRESDVSMLSLSATADDGGVYPADGVALSGAGSTRTLTLTPLEAATGATTITLTLTDPQGGQSTRTFQVNVNARGASMRSTALTTYAKAESDDATTVNGFTFEQDADDPAVFEPLLGTE